MGPRCKSYWHWPFYLWEVLFLWLASRLDLEKFSGTLHVWESRMVLYVFNVPRLQKHSRQVDALQFFYSHSRRREVGRSSALHGEGKKRVNKKLFTLLDLCVSSLRRGHANLLCIVPILTDDPRRESKKNISARRRHKEGNPRLQTFTAACPAEV